MPGTATVTGVIGPAQAVTASVFSNLKFFSITTASEILEMVYDNGDGEKTIQVSIGAATTITCTVSGSTYTLTIS